MTNSTRRKSAPADTCESSSDHGERELPPEYDVEYERREDERLEELEPQRNPEPELDEVERQLEPDEERVLLVGRLKLDVLPMRPPLRCASAKGVNSVASANNSAAARGARLCTEDSRRPMRTRSVQRARAGEYRNGTRGASPVFSATNRNNSRNESQPSPASTRRRERIRCEHDDDKTRPR
jgi:hypothetical protein